MTKNSGFYEEKTIKRQIILELPNVKTSYDEYCELMWKERLDEIASDDTLLNLVREWAGDEAKKPIREDRPYDDLELVDNLYSIPFTIKDVEKKSFSISAENYIIFKIMLSFSILGIPQYRKYELSQQLRYNVDEVFFAKTHRAGFWLDMLEFETELLNELMYTYVKYHRNVKYYRDDEMTKFGHNFIAKGDNMHSILKLLRGIHYKENLTKNYLPFYLVYLTITYGIELYIIYEHTERTNCFKICDAKESKKYIEKWCTIIWLYDILIEAFSLFGSNEEPMLAKWKIWQKVLDDIIEASEKCVSFKYSLEWSSWLPMLWQIEFVHTDLTKFDELAQYAGDFWWVIPMSWTNEKKILEGKKKLNYKKDRKKDKNK